MRRKVSRVLARVRSSSRHSTGTMTSASPGQTRMASRLAKNVMSSRTSRSAAKTAMPSAIPAGWLGVATTSPWRGTFSKPVVRTSMASVRCMWSSTCKPGIGATTSIICRATS